MFSVERYVPKEVVNGIHQKTSAALLCNQEEHYPFAQDVFDLAERIFELYKAQEQPKNNDRAIYAIAVCVACKALSDYGAINFSTFKSALKVVSLTPETAFATEGFLLSKIHFQIPFYEDEESVNTKAQDQLNAKPTPQDLLMSLLLTI